MYQRLAEEYSSMSDERLKELAADYADLTETARTTLKAELRRRGLTMPSEDTTPETDSIDSSKLVTISHYRDLPDALLAKGLLEIAGIECFLADDNVVRLDWFLSNAIGNMRLQVEEDDAAEALEILNQPISDDAPPDESA